MLQNKFILAFSMNINKKIIGIIPARYASTRFPGKPLVQILGKSMIERVYNCSVQAKKISKVVVATDDRRIADHVISFGGEVVLTSPHHASGTDRCYEALTKQNESFDYVINIQGDEPFLNPNQIDELCNVCNGNVELATQMIKVNSSDVLFDKGEVKIVLNRHQEALYFSRMVIPFIKGVEEKEWHLHHTYYRHVGMYAYRADVLKSICSLKPSLLEKAESLEQLRWLEGGYKITCVETKYASHCIDTPEDIEKVLALLNIQ
jgi:3-deoxy-manno-octulosonate cytidylyltransferase (CMP-KDO synthetase)